MKMESRNSDELSSLSWWPSPYLSTHSPSIVPGSTTIMRRCRLPWIICLKDLWIAWLPIRYAKLRTEPLTSYGISLVIKIYIKDQTFYIILISFNLDTYMSFKTSKNYKTTIQLQLCQENIQINKLLIMIQYLYSKNWHFFFSSKAEAPVLHITYCFNDILHGIQRNTMCKQHFHTEHNICLVFIHWNCLKWKQEIMLN